MIAGYRAQRRRSTQEKGSEMPAAGAGTRAGLRAVAAFEGLKGALVLAAGCGALALVHRDLQAVAENVVRHLHMNPASRVPRIFLEAASRTTDARLWGLAALAAAYAAVRLAEAYGLWNGRRWAEWLGAASGGLYVPVEVYEIARHVTVTRAVLLVGNVLVVAYLLRVLYLGRVEAAAQRAAQRGYAGVSIPGKK